MDIIGVDLIMVGRLVVFNGFLDKLVFVFYVISGLNFFCSGCKFGEDGILWVCK